MKKILFCVVMSNFGFVFSQTNPELHFPEVLPISNFQYIAAGNLKGEAISKGPNYFLIFNVATSKKAIELSNELGYKLDAGMRKMNNALYICIDKYTITPNEFKNEGLYVINYKDLSKSDFKFLKISEKDFPIIVFYNGKKLCGYAKTINQINTLPCVIKASDKKIKGTLYSENNKVNKPISKEFVYLVDNNDTISKTLTGNFGEFEMALKSENKNAKLIVNNKKLPNAILATLGGEEIGQFKKSANGFEYKLLELDIVKLSDLPSEDVMLKFKEKSNQKNENIVLIENIVYESDKFSLSTNSKNILDKFSLMLEENKNLKLEVISHTDAQGDDESNMKLSQNRSNAVVKYLIAKGVNPERLKAIGKGETEIRNRCANNVVCSDKEQEFNRRTEFKFVKN